MVDVIIVGCGPSGITAGIYLKRANKEILVFDKGIPGGQMLNTSSIDNYPGSTITDGPSLASEMYSNLRKLNTRCKREEVLKVEKVEDHFLLTTNKSTYESKNVILAMGLIHNTLKFENEDKFIGKGISFCAICDGSLYKDEIVSVVGGGNSAVEEALYLSNIASKVNIIHRRSTFRCDESILSRAKEKENIDFYLNEEIDSVDGEDTLSSIKLKSGKMIESKALFEYVGNSPVTSFLSSEILNDKGYIKVDKNYETKIKGLYAIGDCIEKDVRQVATAVGDGAYCASIINRK